MNELRKQKVVKETLDLMYLQLSKIEDEKEYIELIFIWSQALGRGLSLLATEEGDKSKDWKELLLNPIIENIEIGFDLPRNL